MSKEKFECHDRSMGFTPRDQFLSNLKVNDTNSSNVISACELFADNAVTGTFAMVNGATDGYVLTSDSKGNAHWSPTGASVCTGAGELTVGNGGSAAVCLTPGADGSVLSVVAGLPSWIANPNTPYDPVAAGEISWTPNQPVIDSLQGTGTQFVRIGNIIYMTGAWVAVAPLPANDPSFLDAGTINFLTVSPYPIGGGPGAFNSYNNVAYFTSGPSAGQLAILFQPGIPVRLYNTGNIALGAGAAINMFASFVVQ